MSMYTYIQYTYIIHTCDICIMSYTIRIYIHTIYTNKCMYVYTYGYVTKCEGSYIRKSFYKVPPG